MPAVTVDNILALDRVPRPAPDSAERAVTSVTTAPSGFEGEGFPVRRAFTGIPAQQIDPFTGLPEISRRLERWLEKTKTTWTLIGSSTLPVGEQTSVLDKADRGRQIPFETPEEEPQIYHSWRE